MPLLSPVFREINFQRIRQLDTQGYQPATIAKIINDETGRKEKVLAPDVRGYLKMQKLGSERMLVSKKGLDGIAGLPDQLQPE
jgi:hypothetical protein